MKMRCGWGWGSWGVGGAVPGIITQSAEGRGTQCGCRNNWHGKQGWARTSSSGVPAFPPTAPLQVQETPPSSISRPTGIKHLPFFSSSWKLLLPSQRHGSFSPPKQRLQTATFPRFQRFQSPKVKSRASVGNTFSFCPATIRHPLKHHTSRS